MKQSGVTRRSFVGLAVGTAALPLNAGAATGHSLEWKMVTSWPKNSPGPGQTAERLAQRINQMSAGQLQVRVYGAREIVPALEVFDTVARGTAALGHTASFFWQGKMRASAFFTAVPFGLTADEHAAWINHGGGQELWDELYAGFGVKPLMAGNTGMGMGGWFKKELTDLSSIKGLKYRMPGLGGEVLRRMGGVPVSLPPGEIFSALQSGVVDGAEFLGPWSDRAFGLYKAAPYYYWPGFHEPNGTGECLINAELWETLPAHLKEIVRNACAAENAYALSETEWYNAKALQELVSEHSVQVREFPHDILEAARTESEKVMAEFADRDELSQRIYSSYEEARQRAIAWSLVSKESYLNARSGHTP